MFNFEDLQEVEEIDDVVISRQTGPIRTPGQDGGEGEFRHLLIGS